MKKVYAAGAVLAAVMAVEGAMQQAAALEVSSKTDKVAVTLYGQVNRAVMYADDGNDSETFHVDNSNSSSRIGVEGKAKPTDDLTVGARFEFEVQSNPSTRVNFDDESINAQFKERYIDFYVGGSFGKISLGQGDMASNDTTTMDLSKTAVIGSSSPVDIGEAIVFYDNFSMSYSGISAGDVINSMDGLSRKDRVRYDTPSFGGFVLSGSTGEDSTGDIAATFLRKFGETSVAAALAWADPGTGKDYDQWSGSASVLFPFGLNLTFASGLRDLDNGAPGDDDPAFMYGKVGYLADFVNWGYTAFSVDYGVWEALDSHDDDEEATSYGIQVVQKIDSWSTELYAQYRIFELDLPGTDMEDISTLVAGARIKF